MPISRLLGYRYRRFVTVRDFPELNKREKGQLLYWTFRVDDAWGSLYGASNTISRLFKRKSLALWELERFAAAIRWALAKYGTMGMITDVDIELCKRLQPILEKALQEARALADQMTSRDRIIGEQDVMRRQLLIAKLNTIAAVASAVAALAAAVIAYLQLGNKP